MILWCNTNQGFISAILALFSVIISAIAICISISTSKMQAQTQLLQQRLSAYSQLKKAYSFFKRYVEIARDKPYLSKCHFANILLYSLNSPQEKICDKILNIRKKLNLEPDEKEKQALEEKWVQISDDMVPYVLETTTLLTSLKNDVHLLYTDNLFELLSELIDQYELFLISHFLYQDKELDDAILQMQDIITKLDSHSIMERVEQQTLKKSFFQK